MSVRRSFANPVIRLLLVLFLVCATTGTVSASRERYIPPTFPTETPALEPTMESESATMRTDDAAMDAGTTPSSGGVISAPVVDEAPVPEENVRARPDTRPVELAEVTEEPTAQATEVPAGPVRLDDPVLRWLPEILLAAEESGTPAHVIAGVMRLESGGNPNIISPVGARGLMQIMPSNLSAMGVPESLWHDPATNIWAGGQFLASRAQIYGSWDQAIGAYFGFGCDVFGTCTEVYIRVALDWAAYYQPAIADPLHSFFAVLPPGWVPPAINPFVEAAPEPVKTPPPAPAPAETPSATPEPGETLTPTEIPSGEPTLIPTEVPTEIPTEVPTEVPTEIPTEVPTEAPTEAPVDTGTPPV